jgi:glycosyltransferase involved in cell wall biosynthesis
METDTRTNFTEVPAKAEPPKQVCIVAPAFFDMSGRTPYFGGAERYLVELVYPLRSMGYEPEVYQPGTSDWVRYFRDISITALDTGGSVDRLNQVFHSRVAQPDLTIYLAFHQAYPRCFQPSIGISHGVYWDNEYYQASAQQLQETTQHITRAFHNLTSIVSVDTNTINWLRTIQWPLSEKFHYIPNFVDSSQFTPRPEGFEREAGKVVILFPRRFYRPRGFWLMADVMPSILKRFPDAVFYFVGQPDSEREREFVESAMRTYPGRVRWDVLPPERMHEAYWASDISVIPTVFAEGTSLSCIEAMACGNAVIATNVGGLPNVILHRYNGLLIRPQAQDLLNSLEKLIEDKPLREGLGRKAIGTARAFSISEWQTHWRKILQGHLPHQPPRQVRGLKKPPRTIVIENPSLPWAKMKQRPHYIAEQFARAGWKVFWRKAVDEPAPAIHNLHFMPQDVPGHASNQFVYIFYPYDYEHIDNYSDPIVIYDVLDDISIHDASDNMLNVPAGKRARDYHDKLLSRADLLITSSRPLYEHLIKLRPDVMLVPNGVDLSRFDPQIAVGQPQPKDIARIPTPRIGFHGALAEWLDIKLMVELARSCPRYQFVFVGPVSYEEVKQLSTLENCHLLGEKPPEAIPHYISAMDVGILPFLINPLTLGVRPLKVLESLAMRRPVVATPLPEIKSWPYVFTAEGSAEFTDAIGQALAASKNMDQDGDLDSFLEANSWHSGTKHLLRRLNRVLIARARAK